MSGAAIERRTSFSASEVEALLALEDPTPWSEHKILGLPNVAERGDRAVLTADGHDVTAAAIAASHDGAWNVEVAGEAIDRAAALADLLDWLQTPVVQLWLPRSGDDQHLQAARAGYEVTGRRSLLQLERDLTAWPPMDAGLTLDCFCDEDLDEWVAANNEAFAGHPEQGVWSTATFEERAQSPWFDPALFLLYKRQGLINAWCWCKVDGAHDATRGEIYVIGVAPSAQGQKFGTAMLEAGCAAMAARGVSTVELYVDGDNTAALAMYEHHGFTLARSIEALELTAEV